MRYRFLELHRACEREAKHRAEMKALVETQPMTAPVPDEIFTVNYRAQKAAEHIDLDFVICKGGVKNGCTCALCEEKAAGSEPEDA